MTKPFPVIFLPRIADHPGLINGLYDLGYHYSMYQRDEGIRRWLGSMGTNPDKALYPWVMLKVGGFVSGQSRRDNVSANCTPVNSVRHFLAYARGLKAQS